jgi:hypothetical protein
VARGSSHGMAAPVVLCYHCELVCFNCQWVAASAKPGAGSVSVSVDRKCRELKLLSEKISFEF